jgi:hypothetical protein
MDYGKYMQAPLVDHNELDGLRKYLYIENHRNWYAVTLTMKQRLGADRLDKIKSTQNFKHFMNLLNRRLFGNAHRRFEKRIDVIPAFEVAGGGRQHYHIAIKNPAQQPIKFGQQIRDCWLNTRWGYSEIDINYQMDNGWIDYITKTTSKNSIDWENFYRDC